MHAPRIPAIRWLLGAALALASAGAWALGLGDIRVKSQPGQPLLAEIPIISSDPAELENLRAGLASPVIFERVGLERPRGLVSELDFAVAVGDDGKPVIRVTSATPVEVPTVNFLVEVDWGQGRLVREYSALVSAPGTLAAAAEPAIDAPLPAPSNTIVREPEAAVAAAPAPAPAAPQASAPKAAPAAPAPVTRPAPASYAPAAAPATAAGSGQVTVQRGQTLSQIARELGQGQSLDQTMIALLRANPEAFIGGNINRLKQGAVLRVPQTGEAARLGEAEAAALVRQQVAEWRQARRPIPQPASAAGEAVAASSRPSAPAVADARLEIAPPAAKAGEQAGTTSGIQAGGEGDMLANEQLRQTREDLAARDSEVQELRTRVAEMEKLQQQQAKLIAMKDSDLAAAQQRLDQNQGGQGGAPGWLWFGLALVVIGLLAGFLLRRRAQPVAVPRPSQGSAAMATAVAAAGRGPDADLDGDATEAARYTPVYVQDSAPPAESAPPPQWTAPDAPTARPTWHTGSSAAAPTLSFAAAPASMPTPDAPAGSRARLELAVAYLDLGDIDSARQLLTDVTANGDLGDREEAAQLLRELG